MLVQPENLNFPTINPVAQVLLGIVPDMQLMNLDLNI